MIFAASFIDYMLFPSKVSTIALQTCTCLKVMLNIECLVHVTKGLYLLTIKINENCFIMKLKYVKEKYLAFSSHKFYVSRTDYTF